MYSSDFVFLNSPLSTSKLFGCFSKNVEFARPCKTQMTKVQERCYYYLVVPNVSKELWFVSKYLVVSLINGVSWAQFLLLHLNLLWHFSAVNWLGWNMATDLVYQIIIEIKGKCVCSFLLHFWRNCWMTSIQMRRMMTIRLISTLSMLPVEIWLPGMFWEAANK